MPLAKQLITSIVTALLVFVFGLALCAHTGAVAPSPATDANSRLARLEQQTADAKSSADNAWMFDWRRSGSHNDRPRFRSVFMGDWCVRRTSWDLSQHGEEGYYWEASA